MLIYCAVGTLVKIYLYDIKELIGIDRMNNVELSILH